MLRKTTCFVFALAVGMFGIETGAAYLATGQLGYGRPAEAIVGRPLTPVSVAGVGRRTMRRCATGIYYC